MASQDSLAACNLQIYFVVPEKYESEEQCDETMWNAYNTCIQNEFQPRWIEEKSCGAMKPQKNDVFVMEEFEGAAFELLKTFKCLIVGPRCLLNCFLSGEPIPEGTHPVFTTAMRGMIVCVSGYQIDLKKKIEKTVHHMGGIFMKQLRSCVTHLISNSVWSEKYEKAIDLRIPILTDRWVEAIWEANLRDFVKADDPRFDCHKCPVFMKLVVTSTNLLKPQKEEVKKLINQHGGTFMGILDGTKVKIVLAPESCSPSEKLKYARENNIACLRVDWVYESVKAGYSLPFKDYLIKSTKSCSTPEKSHAPNDSLNFSTISAIPADTRRSTNFVEETMMTTINSCNVMDRTSIDSRSIAAQGTPLDRLDVREAKLAGPFLDGCNIYLTGFSSNQRDKINRVLNAGSATRLDDISDAVTHVIIGDAGKAASDLKIIKSRGLNPYILGLGWLEESVKLKGPASEENHLYDNAQTANAIPAEPPSPLSKKNIKMLQKPKKPSPPPQLVTDKEITTEKPDEWAEGEEEASLMKQYLRKATDKICTAERSFQEFLEAHNRTSDPTRKGSSDTARSFEVSPRTSTIVKPTARQSINDTAIPCSQPTLQFDGLTFLITGFDMREGAIITESVAALGGRIVTNSFVGVPDFGVVPLVGAPLKHTVDEIVTDLYIDDCVENQRVVKLKDYHRPLPISTEVKPLADCVIATSSYTGIERTYLTNVASALGAKYQDTFARKTNVAKGLVGSTHLLCPTPEGGKYNAAVKWKIPAVTSEWLLACATKMKLVSEEPYLVGESIAPARPREPEEKLFMGPPSVPTPREFITPRRHLQRVQEQVTPSVDTPPVHRRLSAVMSDTLSPLEIATPDSPYGQVFKPNPSPATRKGWLRYIESFPDIRVVEPPPKRRRPSTPLSELIRQFWSEVNPGGSKNDASASPSVERESRETSETSVTMNTSVEAARVPEIPVNRTLFTSLQEEKNPPPKKQIELQIEQLDQVLQATSSTTESRYSLSGNAKVYKRDDIETIIDNCMVRESQPDTVGWEDPAHNGTYKPIEQPVPEVPTEINIPKKRKFMLSGIKDRPNYETAIINLGGELSTEANFDPTATHLLCLKPLRNEKLLASIAAGKWVLHASYLRHCEAAREFIDEEKFEWNNPLGNGIIPETSTEQEKSIAAAVHRWRLKLRDAPGGAFRDMTAMLLVPKEKYKQFERLINAGGGVVVEASPPYDSGPNGSKITHCFVQPKQLEQPVEWAMLASKGILCFQPQYLAEYLTAENPGDPRDFVIPEFKKYLSLLPK